MGSCTVVQELIGGVHIGGRAGLRGLMLDRCGGGIKEDNIRTTRHRKLKTTLSWPGKPNS